MDLADLRKQLATGDRRLKFELGHKGVDRELIVTLSGRIQNHQACDVPDTLVPRTGKPWTGLPLFITKSP